ncbi:hypothetical protein D3C78_1968790 [compost metagenome]
MPMRHGLLARRITDREHDGFLAWRIAWQLLLQNLDRFPALLRAMSPGTRQNKQAGNDQTTEG